MATPKTMYQRNKGKIDRPMLALQQQFNQARDQYNKDYTSALGDYQNKLSAYEEQSKAYESKFSEYKQRADAYNTAVAKYNTKSSPFAFRVSQLYGGNSFYVPETEMPDRYMDPRRVAANQQLRAAGLKITGGAPSSTSFMDPTASDSSWVYEPESFQPGGSSGRLYKRAGADPGDFKEKFEDAAPAVPAEPDTAAAKTKLAEAETTYNREVAERKAGKVRARMRTAQRPMLGGVS